ncbi:hypothetical protein JCM3770_001531 [Rhodotorula araucariae]
MLVARTPPSPSGNPYFASRDYAAQPAAPPHASSSNTSPAHLASRPGVARRPSALRKAGSDHIITPAVTRFAARTVHIPPTSPEAVTSAEGAETRASTSSAGRPSSPGTNAAASMLPPPVGAAVASLASSSSASAGGSPPVRPSLSPLGTGSSSSSSGSGLLARRRSSRSTARADVLPMLSDLSLKGALPAAGLALDDLDDTVRPAVIGESSHAQTPASEAASPVHARGRPQEGAMEVVEGAFKPTRSFVPTPFPEKRPHWLSDEEDELDSPVQPFSPVGSSTGNKASEDDKADS